MNKDQKEIFNLVNQEVHNTLSTTMAVCEIPGFIKSTSKSGGYRYKLTFEREKI